MRAPPTQQLVEVVVPLPLPKSFTYKLPPNLTYNDRLQGARVIIPFGQRRRQGFITTASPLTQAGTKGLKQIERLVDHQSIFTPILYKTLVWAADYYCEPLGQVLDTALPSGLRKGQEAEPLFITKWKLSPKGRALDLSKVGSHHQRRLLELLKRPQIPPNQDGTKPPPPEAQELSTSALKAMKVPPATLAALKNKGLISGTKVIKSPVRPFTGVPQVRPQLNQEQQQAVAEITKHFGSFKCFLLEGLTNSGKTEVYIEVIHQMLQRGEQALYLVPEIGLSAQSLERLERSLAIPLGVLHSGMTPRDRLHNYLLMLRNQLKVLVGTRSVAFTPLARPGCIIIDEEHDTSYKQQSGFRYNSKHLLIKLAAELKIPIILGSATPALESLYNAAQGKYTKLRLTQRINRVSKLKASFIQLRGGTKDTLPPEILSEISTTLDAGAQVLIFINRRGYAPVLRCPSCGWQKTCSSCDRPMTLHRLPHQLSCHLCEITERQIPTECPSCQHKPLSPLGLATQRLESLLREKLPQAAIHRIDRDTMGSPDSFDKFYTRVKSTEPCIMLGTQMLAKGHDFSKVELGVILNCDTGLLSNDFHNLEQTAHLITQVIGRVGRKAEGRSSKIILPVQYPDNELLHSLIKEGYAAFAAKELENRKKFQLPPYSYLAYLRAEDSVAQKAYDFLQSLQQESSEPARRTQVSMFGPVESSVAKRLNMYRYSLIIKSNQRRNLQLFLKELTLLVGQQQGQIRTRRIGGWHLELDPLTPP